MSWHVPSKAPQIPDDTVEWRTLLLLQLQLVEEDVQTPTVSSPFLVVTYLPQRHLHSKVTGDIGLLC